MDFHNDWFGRLSFGLWDDCELRYIHFLCPVQHFLNLNSSEAFTVYLRGSIYDSRIDHYWYWVYLLRTKDILEYFQKNVSLFSLGFHLTLMFFVWGNIEGQKIKTNDANRLINSNEFNSDHWRKKYAEVLDGYLLYSKYRAVHSSNRSKSTNSASRKNTFTDHTTRCFHLLSFLRKFTVEQ